jgi:hypothetical protein
MKDKYYLNYIFISLVVLLCTSCSYIQHRQQQATFESIQNDISTSTLDKINKYTSRGTFNKTYEFELINSANTPYALIFYINESSFSKSIIKHRQINDLRRNAVRIDESKDILTTLNNNLPRPNNIIWQQVANQIEQEDARDSYFVLQEYIRHKIRDL